MFPDLDKPTVTQPYQICVHVLVELYLEGLEAHGRPVATVHDEVFTVEPEQTVGHVSSKPLRSHRHLLRLQRREAAHLREYQDQV